MGKPDRVTHKNLENLIVKYYDTNMLVSKEYIAGFIDGEGCLGITRKNTPQCKYGYRFVPYIKVAQVEKHSYILDIFKERYGGHIAKTRKHGGNQNNSVMWELKNNAVVKRMVEDLIDFLVIKKPQAKVLLEFTSIRKGVNGNSNEHKKIRREIYYEKETLYEEIKQLNQRGLAETK